MKVFPVASVVTLTMMWCSPQSKVVENVPVVVVVKFAKLPLLGAPAMGTTVSLEQRISAELTV